MSRAAIDKATANKVSQQQQLTDVKTAGQKQVIDEKAAVAPPKTSKPQNVDAEW